MKMKGEEYTEGTMATFISKNESHFDRKCLYAITLYWTEFLESFGESCLS